MNIDVARVIDDGSWTSYQKLLVAGTALTIILDGIDNQLLGNAIPSLMAEWSLPRSAFSTALAMSPLGMMIGGALGGVLGDRIGRRTALLASVISFAALTTAIAAADGVTSLGALRFIAGLGLGGAMPNAAALACEYVPRRQRPFAVTLTIVCIPLGGMLAAFLSARVIPAYGWRALFMIGGIVPMALAVALWRVMPESPRFLAGKPQRRPELIALLLKFGHSVPADADFTRAESENSSATRYSIVDLFSAAYVRDTLALFVSFFFCLLVNYTAFQLLVPMLTGAGFSQPDASGMLGWWNIGGVAGALFGALLIQRFGSRITMFALSLIAIVSAFFLAAMPLDPQKSLPLLLMCIILGGTLNAVQTTMYALAAHVFPTEIRGTGIGMSLAVGRIGNVLASYVGNFALDAGGAPAYFATFGFGMIAVFLALAVVGRHINRWEEDVPVEVAETVEAAAEK
jgi:AAHS family 4-hydroxybenzoate transporter-like MFS transporter